MTDQAPQRCPKCGAERMYWDKKSQPNVWAYKCNCGKPVPPSASESAKQAICPDCEGSYWVGGETGVSPQEPCSRCAPVAESKTEIPKNLDEFKRRLFNDPIAYAYYNMGRVVERDSHLTTEQRAKKNFDTIYSAIQAGYKEKVLPDIWSAELEEKP